MKDELFKKLTLLFLDEGVQPESVRAKLTVILEEYDITKKTTEIIPYKGSLTEEYLRRFLIAKKVAGLTDRTIKFYKNTLNAAFREISKPPTDVTSDDVRFYLAIKETRDGNGKCALSNIHHVLSTFFNFLKREDLISKNPMDRIESIKQPKTLKHAFTDMEVELIRNACRGKTERMMVEVLLSTGARVSEFAGIKIRDFSKDYGEVTVHGKGQKDRKAYLNAKARLAVKDYLEIRRDNNPFLLPACKHSPGEKGISRRERSHMRDTDWVQFSELIDPDNAQDKSSVGGRIRNLGKRAGIEKCHPHKFRRTFATNALKRGMPIMMVSRLLGHENVGTTQIYLDVSDEQSKIEHTKFVY